MRITREHVIEALEYLISEDCCETQHDYIREIERAIELLRRDAERYFRVINTKTEKEADTYEIALQKVVATECVGREAATAEILRVADEVEQHRIRPTTYGKGFYDGMRFAADIIREMKAAATVFRYDANEDEDEK